MSNFKNIFTCIEKDFQFFICSVFTLIMKLINIQIFIHTLVENVFRYKKVFERVTFLTLHLFNYMKIH